jgi:uncharacterized protein (DUF1800 family)
MINYLNNDGSIGPNSPVGRIRRTQINENLGREVLELHILGVEGGYTQEDVRSLAKVLTGWTSPNKRLAAISRRKKGPSIGPVEVERYGHGHYYAVLHEPGNKTILGKTYDEAGADELRAVIEDLSVTEAAARHLSGKLVSHFVADEPPAPAVDKLALVWLQTGGDLRAVSRALIELDEAWTGTHRKIKTPLDFFVGVNRGLSGEEVNKLAGADHLTKLGQDPFRPPSPEGWPDTAEKWLSPGLLARRVDYAYRAGSSVQGDANPKKLFEEILGGAASKTTRMAVYEASSNAQGIALTFAAPEFMKR